MIADPISREILRRRIALGLHHPDRCPSCRCLRTAPARRRAPDGSLVDGCVDASYSGFLIEPEDAAFHASAAAFESRARDLDELQIAGAA